MTETEPAPLRTAIERINDPGAAARQCHAAIGKCSRSPELSRPSARDRSATGDDGAKRAAFIEGVANRRGFRRHPT